MDTDLRGNIRFNIKQLRAFVEVYRSGRLGSAAERLALTSSAVSVLIAQFEAAAGMKLFDRTARGLIPTAKAHEIARRAENILHEVLLLDQCFQDHAPHVAARVRFATTQSIASFLMPRVINRFKELHPQVQVVMHDCTSDQVSALVTAGEVDFGLASFARDVPHLAIDVVLSDTISAIFPETSPLAARQELAWEEVLKHPVIMSRHGGDGGTRQLVDEALAAQGMRVTVAHEASSMSTALSMALHGLGVAIYPPLLMPYLPTPGLTARKLVGPEVVRHMAVARRRGEPLTKAASQFVAMLRESLAAGKLSALVDL